MEFFARVPSITWWTRSMHNKISFSKRQSLCISYRSWSPSLSGWKQEIRFSNRRINPEQRGVFYYSKRRGNNWSAAENRQLSMSCRWSQKMAGEEHRKTISAHISAKRFISLSLRRMLPSRRSLSLGLRPSNLSSDLSAVLVDLAVGCSDTIYWKACPD